MATIPKIGQEMIGYKCEALTLKLERKLKSVKAAKEKSQKELIDQTLQTIRY